jgi:hypothetical protein
MAHSTLENMKTGSEPASSGGRSSEDGRPSVCADSLLGSARVRRNPLRSARNTPDVRQRATTDSSACPSARGGCGALQATARPLPLDQLATELGVHVRTLQAAARSGRLAAHFSIRSVFGRPIRLASRAASGSDSPDLGTAGRREGGARDGRCPGAIRANGDARRRLEQPGRFRDLRVRVRRHRAPCRLSPGPPRRVHGSDDRAPRGIERDAQPIVIGAAGGAGSVKTTVVRRIFDALPRIATSETALRSLLRPQCPDHIHP